MSDIHLTIDGIDVTAAEGTNILEAARSVGIGIPFFCYHPKLTRPANCRMCLVEIEGRPKLTPSCATPVAEGMVVRTNTPRVNESHRSVMEFYLTNHPLDCPVCDQAGECVLQDYSYTFGRATSRFEDCKVTQPVKAVGRDIVLYADRCIMCSRCTRFLDEVSGTRELVIAKRGVYNEIHNSADRRVDNPLAGNIVDICPVGALCSKDFLFKCRVWWLHSTRSSCARCARACSILIDTNGGEIQRIKPLENPEVNGPWMCDFGRFAFKEWRGEGRLDRPLARTDSEFRELTWGEATEAVIDGFSRVIREHGPRSVAVIGSPWATIEENMLLVKLFCSLGGDTCSVWPAPAEDRQEFPGFTISGEKAWNVAGAQQALQDVCGSVVPLDRLADLIEDRRIRAVYALGGGYRHAQVDYEDLAFEELELLVIQTCFMSEKGLRASIVLPGASPYEKTGSVRNEDGVRQEVNAAVDPPGQARCDWDILWDIAGGLAARLEGLTKPHDRPEAHWSYSRGHADNE